MSIAKALCIAAAVAIALPQAAEAKHFKIWLKAFIPNTGLQIVKPVPGAAGHTMISGPPGLGCFNTNDRGFKADPKTEAKVTIITEFDVLSPGVGNVSNFSKDTPTIGPTVRYDCSSGAVTGTNSASDQEVTIGQPTFTSNVVSIPIDAVAFNPYVRLPAAIAPSIKVKGTLTVDLTAGRAGFAGTVAKFPSYEAYVSADRKPPVAIFKISPAEDASAWSLYFNTPVDSSVKY